MAYCVMFVHVDERLAHPFDVDARPVGRRIRLELTHGISDGGERGLPGWSRRLGVGEAR